MHQKPKDAVRTRVRKKQTLVFEIVMHVPRSRNSAIPPVGSKPS